MQFRSRCAAVLTAVLLCSAAALPALAEETATPETADSVASASTYTGWKRERRETGHHRPRQGNL